MELTNLASRAMHSQKSTNELFERIYPLIWHYYKVRLNDVEEAKDMTQNACIKIFNNLSRYDKKKAKFTTWVYVSLRNMLIDHYRKRSLSVENIKIDLLESTESPLQTLIKNEEADMLKKALQNVPNRQKEILELKYFFYMKNKEIASILKIKEKTVSSLIVRALGKLESILKDRI